LRKYEAGGPGACCLDFVNQAKALSEKRKVIICDQSGVGEYAVKYFVDYYSIWES